MFAQSIGGSGGNAGGVYTGTSNVKKRSSTNFSIGGNGGTGAGTGVVTAKNQGNSSSIQTTGDGSHGILSLGGGGGKGGMFIT